MKIVSGLVALQGVLLGMLIVAVAAGDPVLRAPPDIVLTAVVAGLTPILAGLIATRSTRTASRISLWVAPFACLLLLRLSWQFGGILHDLEVFLGAIVVPGFFWLFAARRNWPRPLVDIGLSGNRVLAIAVGSMSVCVFALLAFLASLSLPWWVPIGDCLGRPLFDERGVPRNIDFTAKIFIVGPPTFQGYSLWSIATIEDPFSAVQWRRGNIVILRGFFRSGDKSQLYFVEGRRSPAALTHFLPVILPVECGRTGPRDSEAVAIRLLHDGPPKSGARLIGRVLKGKYTPTSVSKTPLHGNIIAIEGSAGSIVSATDSEGIYSVDGLLPGRYTIHIATTGVRGLTSRGGEKGFVDLRLGEIDGEDFYIE